MHGKIFNRGDILIIILALALLVVVPVGIIPVTAQGINLALGRPAFASSIERSDLAANRATDGNLQTRWSSVQRVDPQWIYVDLGQVFSIRQVVLRWESYAESYRIEFSNNAANWTTVSFQEAKNGAVDIIPVSGSARYVRMFGLTRGHSGFGYSLFEFEVYDQPVFEVPPPQERPPAPVPGLGTLFFDDFSDGADPRWNFLSGNWNVVDGALETTAPCASSGFSSAVVGDSSWTDYEVQFDFRGMAGSVKQFQFRYADATSTGRYVWQARNLENDISVSGGGFPETLVPFPIQQGIWYRVRIRVEGERIQVFVDDQLVLDRTDTGTQRLSGGVGPFLRSGTVNCPFRVQYDNVIVNEVGRPEVDLSITRITPIQVIENVFVNDDSLVDLVLNKPMIVRLEVQVDNPGALDQDQEVQVRLNFQDQMILRTRTLADLQAGQVDFFLTPGVVEDASISVTVDPNNLVVEANEDNNQASRMVSIKDTQSFYIVHIPITYRGELSEYAETVQNGGDFVRAVYPVAPSEFTNQRIDVPFIGTPFSLDPNRDRRRVLDLLALWTAGKLWSLGRADRVVGIAPNEYIEYMTGCSNVGGYAVTSANGSVLKSVIVLEGLWTATAHELGHTYGLGEGYVTEQAGDCSSGLISAGQTTTGYWVERSEFIETSTDFMGTSPGLHSFDRWAVSGNFVQLFSQFLSNPTDPEILLVSGVVNPDGAIQLQPLYRLPEGFVDEVIPGDYSLQVLNSEGNLLQAFDFGVASTLFMEPFPPVELDTGAFAFAIPYPQDADRILILHNGSTLTDTVLTTQLLHDAVDAIPDFGFIRNPGQRRNTLHNMIDALEAQIRAGNLSGAINKLERDIRPTLERWLVDGYSKDIVLQYTKAEILALVDEMIGRLTASLLASTAPELIPLVYPTFNWGRVPGAVCYEIQIDNNEDFSSPIQDATLDGTQYNADLLPNGIYHWRVRVGGNCINVPSGPWSEVDTFTVSPP